eukprot:CAMPEP_0172365214 /NCGR_PEP_ID=MMETSP1060-20121228/8174_1 /TAXON_ID=37318 /ORGANISM="Pseudo-nitzschia pungens, Strain cf. cingulata" /LENGTH=941 /DNA_ID=CAMNT_0013088429 /DNA_START=66 /DNA_END=2888 /DNA_ORIENTATION=+
MSASGQEDSNGGPSGAVSGKKRKATSLSQLIQLRDSKRETLSRLFEEKKKIMERMKLMNDELIELDDEIETLEEARDQRRLSRSTTNVTSHATSPVPFQVKSEPNAESDATDVAGPSMTMNPDEVLTEPTQSYSPAHEEYDNSEQLTDPLTWTQAENATNDNQAATTASLSTAMPNAVPQHQQHLHSPPHQDDDDEDIEEHHNGSTSNHQDRESESHAQPKLVAASTPQRKSSSGPLDNFVIRSPRRPNNNDHNTKQQYPSTPTTASSSCPYSKHDIHQTLRQSFRLQFFRENQFEIIQSTLSGKDTFVLMKTGGGKSLLYQLPAILESPKVTVVVSPLLSLIQDQEDQMNAFVRDSCVSFTSGMGTAQHTENWKRVRDVTGGVVMILVTPERVFKSGKLKSELQNLYEQNRLGRFVIDECHCACQWGHDFRPDYAKLQVLRSFFPHVPIMAVTATASEDVKKDCMQIFQLSKDYAFFRSTANRPNLAYQVRPKQSNVIEDMVNFIKSKHPRSAGIVYTYSRKDADTVAFDLCEHGIVAESYHSDVTPARKWAIHQSWMANQTQVVVATIAFGLGINKPDVRFVLHHTLSKTLESYYQESGRAGRDGDASDCVLYYSPKDVPRMLKMIHGESSEDLFLSMVKYAQQFGNDDTCRSIILKQMGEPNQDFEEHRGINDMVEWRDVTSHAKTLLEVLVHFRNKNMTMNMLITEWRKVPSTALECVKNNPPGKDLTKDDCEGIVIALLMYKLIEPLFRFTAYSTVVYLRCTESGRKFIPSNTANIRIPLPKSVSKKRKSTASTPAKDDDGWVEANASKRKRVSKALIPSSKKKASAKKAATKKAATKKPTAQKTTAKKATTKKATAKRNTTSTRRKATKEAKVTVKKPVKRKEDEVIELIDDSDDSDSSEVEIITSTKRNRPRRAAVAMATDSNGFFGAGNDTND